MTFLTLLCALALSGIAAYYSVIGLAAIFTGAFWPIVFMGSVLEASKLVTTSWLYRNWKNCPFLLKSYLTFAVVILMVITSMGIFGFLSKAHIDSTMDAGANTIEVKTLVQQEKIVKERLDYLLARAKDPSTASNRLDRQIQDTQKELADINKKKLPLLKESNKLTAEVGPIKYVGDMIYGTEDENGLDKAVRLVIMLIMVVFDPLAVLLLIAANMSMKQKSGTPIVNHGEIVGLTPSDIPVFTDTINKLWTKKADEPKETDAFKNHKAIWKKKEYGIPSTDTDENPPLQEPQVEESVPLENPTEPQTVEIDKENIAAIEERTLPVPQQILLDEATGETIPPISAGPVVIHHAPGVYEEHHDLTEEPPQKITKYDYDAEYAFREKGK